MIPLKDMFSLWKSLNGRLISWKDSGAFELAANEVLCITPTLEWARENIDAIIADLGTKTSKAYRYIVFANQEPKNDLIAVENANRIIEKVRAHPSTQSRDCISILFLTRDGAASPSYCWRPSSTSTEVPPLNDWAYLPVPTDVVVYVQTIRNPAKANAGADDRFTFAVMSVVPVHERLKAILTEPLLENGRYKRQMRRLRRFHQQMKFEYDVQLAHESHYRPIQAWFEHAWRTRTTGMK
jgi:hypothetical protein